MINTNYNSRLHASLEVFLHYFVIHFLQFLIQVHSLDIFDCFINISEFVVILQQELEYEQIYEWVLEAPAHDLEKALNLVAAHVLEPDLNAEHFKQIRFSFQQGLNDANTSLLLITEEESYLVKTGFYKSFLEMLIEMSDINAIVRKDSDALD
ncbi:Hypothetical_protein [Hexamita inflata]|uniref:Hypothetical_protein n=1 Tax=Hexamita inflata TaxID=28002 RepID=A0ABP1JU12_9EUKA